MKSNLKTKKIIHKPQKITISGPWTLGCGSWAMAFTNGRFLLSSFPCQSVDRPIRIYRSIFNCIHKSPDVAEHRLEGTKGHGKSGIELALAGIDADLSLHILFNRDHRLHCCLYSRRCLVFSSRHSSSYQFVLFLFFLCLFAENFLFFFFFSLIFDLCNR